jgi:GT2 family glycosyltransferase
MTPAVPRVSVVICTHNRADRLGDAIRSVLEQESNGMRFELVVVDNRSTDATRETVQRYAADERVRYVFEPVLGLCHARNRGAREARGAYITYLDDDAIACGGWLRAVVDAFESMPDVGVVGGRVDPVWETARPRWLSDDIALSLTIVDWSATPTVITDVRRQWLVGANMAVRAELLHAVGGFHPGLDRVGTRMLSSGDVYLQKQIIARGHRCLYAPAMAVRHVVPASRLTKGWFRRRYYSQGLSDAVMQLLDGHPSTMARARSALAIAGRLLRRPHDLAALAWPTDDPVRFTRKCLAWIAVGNVAGMLGAARR